MKKIALFLAIVLSSYCSHAQNSFPSTSGNVSIGTTDQSALLNIGSSGNRGTVNITGSSSETPVLNLIDVRSSAYAYSLYSGLSASGSFNILDQNAGSYRFTITSSGNVGIGTISPFARLHVQNDANTGTIAIGNNNYPGLITSSSGTGEFRIDNRSSAAAGYISFYPNGQNTTVGAEAMRINTNGNIGIGTTSPGSKLYIAGGSRNALKIDDSLDGTPTSKYLSFWQGTSAAGIDPIGTGVIYLGYDQSSDVRFGGSSSNGVWKANGNVLIGQTTQANAVYKLDVNGSARANEIVVNTSGADFVFDRQYSLRKLSDVKTYINEHHHLPEIPSAKEMQTNGLELGEMNKKLLQKVEELTLYLIEKDKQDQEKDVKLAAQQTQIDELREQLKSIVKYLPKN